MFETRWTFVSSAFLTVPWCICNYLDRVQPDVAHRLGRASPAAQHFAADVGRLELKQTSGLGEKSVGLGRRHGLDVWRGHCGSHFGDFVPGVYVAEDVKEGHRGVL